MSKTQTIAKFAAVAAGFGLVASSFVTALPAFAQTTTTTSSSMSASQTSSLQAQIAALQAQLAASQGTMASVTFTRDLTIGSKGSDVTALQTWLIAKGYSVPAGATGYFGSQTKAALSAYQAANAISPAVGYFGPITRAHVNASAGSTTTTTTTTTGGTTTTTGTTTLAGGEGSLDNFKIVGASNTSLNAADKDTVYGFEFKANGSDLMVTRVDYDIYNSNNTGSTHPWNVFQTATLMDGNTTVATIDASNMSNYSEDGTDTVSGNQVYRLRFDGLKDVVKMGNTADYYLMLSTQNVISSSNSGAIYKVNLTAQGVRATDAMGLQEYSSASTQTSNTVSVSSNTSGSLTLSTGSDNPAVGTTVQANNNSQTSNVVLTTFTLQAKDSDVMVYTIPTNVATTTATASTLVRDLKLYQGSTLIDTESFASSISSTSLKFINLHLKIPAGTTQSFSIQADINNVGGSSAAPEGATVALSIPTNGWDAENGSGNNVPITGSVTGNAITFRSLGLSTDTNPTTSAVSTNVGTTGTQQGTFTFTFNVTAFGQDIFVGTTSSAYSLTVFNNSGGTVVASSSAITSTADKTSSVGNYVIHSGQTKSVTVSATVNGGGTYYYAKLNSLNYGTVDSAGGTTASSTIFNNNYQTAPVYVHA
jgi:peptidoglycan hydrolase-like protein with peptidoglycan-binding domain